MRRWLGIDADPDIRATDHFARTVLLAASDRDASMVMAPDPAQPAAAV